jgi:hypothetical protein
MALRFDSVRAACLIAPEPGWRMGLWSKHVYCHGRVLQLCYSKAVGVLYFVNKCAVDPVVFEGVGLQ